MLKLSDWIARRKNRMNKKALSEVVGYVLLITIAIALSVIVYQWLKFRVNLQEAPACPEGLSLIIRDVSISGTDMNLTVENKGLFTADGFVIRVNDRNNSKLGIYMVNDTGVALSPGGAGTFVYGLSSVMSNPIKFLEVQPFIYEGNERVMCPRVATRSF